MSKAESDRAQTARRKIAAQQAASRQAELKRRAFSVGGTILAVIVLVVGFIVIHNIEQPKLARGAPGKAIGSVTQQISTVPQAALNSVGKGIASPLVSTSGQPPLTMNGKPEVLYMGAEYCPYCAAERWAIATALSRFGSFSNLHFIHSSASDVYPSTPTLTFYKSTYTSKYLAFNPVEMYSLTPDGDSYATLMNPTAAESAAMNEYTTSPYFPASDKDSFPFVDIGNQYLLVGAQYNPQTLHGLTWAQVASDLRNPASTVGREIDGAANSITAAICKITKDQPAAACSSAAATAGAGSI